MVDDHGPQSDSAEAAEPLEVNSVSLAELIRGVDMLRVRSPTAPASSDSNDDDDEDDDFFDPNDESWLDGLDASERGYCYRCGKAFALDCMMFCTGCGHFFRDEDDYYVLPPDVDDEPGGFLGGKVARAFSEPKNSRTGPARVERSPKTLVYWYRPELRMKKKGSETEENR